MRLDVHRIHVAVFGKRQRKAPDRLRTVAKGEVVAEGLVRFECNAHLTFAPSEVQHQLLAARPRHAGHDVLARGLLRVRQKVIVVHELAVELEHVGSGRSRRRRRGTDRAPRRRPPRCSPAGSDRAARARRDSAARRNTSKASPTGGALNCSQWMWLSGQPQRARGVDHDELIIPAGPHTYTCVPSGCVDSRPRNGSTWPSLS